MQIMLLTNVVPTRFNRKQRKPKTCLLNVTKLSDLASNDDVVAVAQPQQFLLMQLLLHVHQLSILQYFMLQYLSHDDSLVFVAQHAKSRMSPLCRKNTYCNPYYCLSRTILLSNSYQYYCLVLKMLLLFHSLAYWEVLKCFSYLMYLHT